MAVALLVVTTQIDPRQRQRSLGRLGWGGGVVLVRVGVVMVMVVVVGSAGKIALVDDLWVNQNGQNR